MEDKKVYVELSEKEINSLIFQLQERIEHYNLIMHKDFKSDYLEGIQNKLIESRKGLIK
jgi:hypothetical protein|tara:strand:+ start:502 stop:678 length:177 start_codon:yes stop_codon:yes gene_type:complete